MIKGLLEKNDGGPYGNQTEDKVEVALYPGFRGFKVFGVRGLGFKV